MKIKIYINQSNKNKIIEDVEKIRDLLINFEKFNHFIKIELKSNLDLTEKSKVSKICEKYKIWSLL